MRENERERVTDNSKRKRKKKRRKGWRRSQSKLTKTMLRLIRSRSTRMRQTTQSLIR